jgi:S-DNA-T family DNA segregation ATPase FtsK/SpoIIIE
MDELYDDAVRIVLEMGKASTSVLQRRLRIGYGRAASLLDGMQRASIVGPPEGSKPRSVLIKKEDYFSE